MTEDVLKSFIFSQNDELIIVIYFDDVSYLFYIIFFRHDVIRGWSQHITYSAAHFKVGQ